MRYGRTETKFRGTFDADTVHYKAKAPYASWRLQAGWRYPLSETINTDLYARYELNDFGGDSVALHNRTNDTLVAHASTTSTARIGALIPFANSVWSGAAYEHTFGPQGRALLIAFGRPYDVDPMQGTGHTGIFTAKIGYRPERAKDWSFNLHLDGFVGDRLRVAGTFTTTYRF